MPWFAVATHSHPIAMPDSKTKGRGASELACPRGASARERTLTPALSQNGEGENAAYAAVQLNSVASAASVAAALVAAEWR